MKKVIFGLFVIVAVMAFAMEYKDLCLRPASQNGAASAPVFVLPASIREIGEDAFAGTALSQFIQGKQDEDGKAGAVFQLPASLQVIEESAFEGTAARWVEVPESVVSIGDRAFARVENLRAIHIPDGIRYMGRDVFAESNQVTVIGGMGSYARKWAKENGVSFAPVEVFYARAGTQRSENNIIKETVSRLLSDDAEISMEDGGKPTGRTLGELKASRFKGRAALHIQDRYFP